MGWVGFDWVRFDSIPCKSARERERVRGVFVRFRDHDSSKVVYRDEGKWMDRGDGPVDGATDPDPDPSERWVDGWMTRMGG